MIFVLFLLRIVWCSLFLSIKFLWVFIFVSFCRVMFVRFVRYGKIVLLFCVSFFKRKFVFLFVLFCLLLKIIVIVCKSFVVNDFVSVVIFWFFWFICVILEILWKYSCGFWCYSDLSICVRFLCENYFCVIIGLK